MLHTKMIIKKSPEKAEKTVNVLRISLVLLTWDCFENIIYVIMYLSLANKLYICGVIKSINGV